MKLHLPHFRRLRLRSRKNRRRSANVTQSPNYRDGISTFMLPSLFEGANPPSKSLDTNTSPKNFDTVPSKRDPIRKDSPYPTTQDGTKDMKEPLELSEDLIEDNVEQYEKVVEISEDEPVEQEKILPKHQTIETATSAISFGSQFDKLTMSCATPSPRPRFANGSIDSLVSAATSSMSFASHAETERPNARLLRRCSLPHVFDRRLRNELI